jgi:Kef-type K+ transport system membrane component KefB
LTELKLLGSDVGVTVLAAGVGNDVVGWILLALCVALVNNNSGLAALYVLLTSIGYILFLVYAIRPAFIWVLRRQGAIQNGPSQGMITLTLLLVLASSWFTAIIGIHAIFGGKIPHFSTLQPIDMCSFCNWSDMSPRRGLPNQGHRKD